jgi:NAD(P)-dependent dehydrogenase (short-subunit alcohol dehydrogenase family)
VKDKFYNLIFRYFYFMAGQVAALARFLCSDSAKQITSPTLSMDGGWTAQ